jgi:hypothetical protein
MFRVTARHLISLTKVRRQDRGHYRTLLREYGIEATAAPQHHPRHIDNQFVIGCRVRDRLQPCLFEREIATEVYCPVRLNAELYAP